ncbi:Glutamate--tRNA ligase [Rickettsiales endosymbiont of Paramecium tredecaurelia]|uniref:glutamate--tRNA ligase n=1 Tax=Candidatus Sarmatiella mevalonica TaxID=2770581 RepID=UPI0019241B1B|nr:glutamate--tRNA ligase [Candidatus Sarmatiella mevalonica]MBL3284987.1 Glutamate--tRNA ligase [Candidatus Sarmatiella mevalonica]
MNKIVTRFAPSPTGYLHIGSARTALFNYLFAKAHNGKFLLRIEDTDRARSTQSATDAIFRDLRWLGIEWDEEPLLQSQRNDVYKEAALSLVNNGLAYYCFSSQEEIATKRQAALDKGEDFMFHSPWRDAQPHEYPKNIAPVVRLKSPVDGDVTIQDTVQGKITIECSKLDDMVLLRQDGMATYMLAVVVDDRESGITHIIRGDDHLTNAFRQALIYQAFNWRLPSMSHVPLIHGPDGAKLSKRHGALGVDAYRQMGYLPWALCNYLLRLGWSHGDDEIISSEQARSWFNLEALGASPARLDFDKMKHLNAHYLKLESHEFLLQSIREQMEEGGAGKISKVSEQNILKGMAQIKARASLLTDLPRIASVYLEGLQLSYEQEQGRKEVLDQIVVAANGQENTARDLLRALLSCLEVVAWEEQAIKQELQNFAQAQSLKLGNIMPPLRMALTGEGGGVDLVNMMFIVGRDEVVNRMQRFVAL